MPTPASAVSEDREASTQREDQFVGLGLELKADKESLLVVKVTAGSPAARAFIQPGDRIVSVDGQPVAEMSAEKAASLLKGNAGSYVSLAVATGRETPRGLRIRREAIGIRESESAADEVAMARKLALDRELAARDRLRAIEQRDAVEAFQRRIDAQFERLREPLSNEVHLMAQVGQLTPAQTESLKKAGEQALRQHLGPTAKGAPGRLVRWEVQVINGRGIVREELNDPPQSAVRRELMPVLKTISLKAWEKFEADRQRLERRRKHADILAQVAAFDEALLLTSQQRERFCNLLSARWTDVWRGHVNENAGADPAILCLSAVGAMGLFSIPDVELAAALRPSQVAAFKLVQLPTQEHIVALQEAPRPMALNNAGAPAQGGVRVLVKQAEIARKVVRQGIPVEDQRARLDSLLQRLIEDADVSTGLIESQKQTLLLAGKLDLDRYFQQHVEQTATPQPGQQVVLMQRQVAGANVRLPAIFSEGSFYQKALHSRLTPGQLENLAGALRERARFAQEMVLKALVVGLAERAALTSGQCDRLDEALAQDRALTDDAGWRREILRRLSRLPTDPLEPLFDEWQWPAARQYLEQLSDTARRLESQPREEPLAIPAAAGLNNF